MKNKVLVLVTVLVSVMMVSCFLKHSRIREHLTKEPVIEFKEVTLIFPPNTGPVSRIPATPLPDKEIARVIKRTELNWANTYLCAKGTNLLNGGDDIIYVDWARGLSQDFLQWFLNNNDPNKAGKIAWVLNEKLPCAKTLAKFANKRIQNQKYKFDHKLEVEVSHTYKITTSDGSPWKCDIIATETEIIDPLRDERGILINPRLPIKEPCVSYPYSTPFTVRPHMKFADPKVEENISWEERAAFWAGPKSVGQARIITRKAANILLYHPENMVRPEVLDMEFEEED